MLLITAHTFSWYNINMPTVAAVLEATVAIMTVQGLEAAMEVMETVVMCLHIILPSVHLG